METEHHKYRRKAFATNTVIQHLPTSKVRFLKRFDVLKALVQVIHQLLHYFGRPKVLFRHFLPNTATDPFCFRKILVVSAEIVKVLFERFTRLPVVMLDKVVAKVVVIKRRVVHQFGLYVNLHCFEARNTRRTVSLVVDVMHATILVKLVMRLVRTEVVQRNEVVIHGKTVTPNDDVVYQALRRINFAPTFKLIVLRGVFRFGKTFAEVSETNLTMKNFALETAVARFSDVMWAMQQILFMSFDKRLAIFLWDEIAKNGSDSITMTHEQIARYMGSAREVVSRMIKYFVAEGIIETSRGGIKVIDRSKLKALAF